MNEPDLRSKARLTLLIRTAKLVCSHGEYLCIVRNVSESGISVRLFHPLPSGENLTLEMPNGDQYPLQRVWEENGKAGFRLQVPADITRLVETPSPYTKRQVRANVLVECRLIAQSVSMDATICNLSQQGALIRTPHRLALAQRITVDGDGLPEIAAHVRWRRGQFHGLVFDNTFQFAELGAVLYALQSPLRQEMERGGQISQPDPRMQL